MFGRLTSVCEAVQCETGAKISLDAVKQSIAKQCDNGSLTPKELLMVAQQGINSILVLNEKTVPEAVKTQLKNTQLQNPFGGTIEDLLECATAVKCNNIEAALASTSSLPTTLAEMCSERGCTDSDKTALSNASAAIKVTLEGTWTNSEKLNRVKAEINGLSTTSERTFTRIQETQILGFGTVDLLMECSL